MDVREATLARLQTIADALGISIDELRAAEPPRKLWADNEFVHLWQSFKTEAGRNAALGALRRILDEERV